jgi:disulfide oxidoreductase YuzD
VKEAGVVDVRVDPKYQRLVPPLPFEEFESLKVSIREDGLLYPIITNPEGVILDGHQRCRALRQLGMPLTKESVVVREFPDRLSEMRFVIVCNLRRRHLAAFQRAELAYPLLEIERELAKRRQGARTDLFHPSSEGQVDRKEDRHLGEAVAIVARQAGLSRPTFERAVTVIESAPEAIKSKARAGELTVNAAYLRTQTIRAVQTTDLRELVGPDAAGELRRLEGEQFDEAVKATLDGKLTLDEIRRLVRDVESGASAAEGQNRIEAARKDEKARLWRLRNRMKETHATRARCDECREALFVVHLKGGGHRLAQVLPGEQRSHGP